MKVKFQETKFSADDPLLPIVQEDKSGPVAACNRDGYGGVLLQAEKHQVTIDEVLNHHVGNFGRGQILHFLFISLSSILQALHILVPVFAEKSPDWNYILNINSNATSSHGHSQVLSTAILPDYAESLKEFDDQFMFRPPTAISNVLNNSVIRTSAPPCSLSDSKWSWLDKSESTVSQWDLVCDRAYLQGFAQSAFFIGGILGSSIFGHLSDWKLGRRGALALSTISLSVFGMLTAVAPNYGIYVICRALTGASSSGLAVASYVLIMELIGPSCRATVGLSTMYFFPIGSFLLVAVASAYRKLASVNYSWRYVYVITSIPSALYSISVVPSIHESPRWHLVRGRTQKAMEVLRSVAKKNGRNLTNDVVLITDHRNKDVFQNNENMPQEKGSLVQVFRRRDTRYRIIVLVVSWFACALGYYVFNLNVGNLGTNIYLSVTLNGMVEIPGYAVATLLLHRIGRRRSLVAALIVAGMATLSGAVLSSSMIKLSSISAPGMSVPTSDTVGRDAGLIPVHNHASPEMKTMGILSIAESHILRATEAATYIQLASSLMSLFCLSAAYNILYFYGSELFPTTVRNAAVSFAYQGGTMGSIVAPLVVASAQVNSSIPYFIIGAASLVSGVIAIKLPETMNTQLYESFEDMDTNLNEV